MRLDCEGIGGRSQLGQTPFRRGDVGMYEMYDSGHSSSPITYIIKEANLNRQIYRESRFGSFW